MRDEHWAKLTQIYQNQGIVLALGSGVSIGSRLPNWEELIRRLAEEYLPDDGAARFAELYDQRHYSLPAITSIIETHCAANGLDFVKGVREALYRDFPAEIRDFERDTYSAFTAHQKVAGNTTLRAAAALCVRATESESTGKKVYAANPKLHAVVNFNLDSLLHYYITARYWKRLTHVVERASADDSPRQTRRLINIYHMHGYLHLDPKRQVIVKESPDKLILTEGRYFEFINNPNSMFNYTFLYLLREHTCLFVGLSMQDDNLRRLLYYSQAERRRSYEDEQAAQDIARQKTRRHFAILQHSTGTIDNLIETSLEPLGVQVLWVKEFCEIPTHFAAVYGPDWSKVY